MDAEDALVELFRIAYAMSVGDAGRLLEAVERGALRENPDAPLLAVVLRVRLGHPSDTPDSP